MRGKYSIALAEDDPDDQLLFRDALKLLDVDVNCEMFSHGVELIHFLNYTLIAPDIIILDLNMPIMNGLTTLQRLNEREETKDIPAFILTTSNSAEDRERCRMLGAKGYYCKPDSIRELGAIVSGIIHSLSR